ncbi:ankyrin repeat-containing domain protein [Lasiosphaeris hirsuta]|uniref:Ankyrin repeat-containing domain protein n=1 Tax=Lasiosphaeris hirsuta TaxID=260670 RepID=A0AA40AY18_9PEZI|nr:ankyrin repeat-containing domain protein [Lasiosphaeris hirsuta]
MEAVGAIVGIADVALRTSSKLWSLSSAWRDAPEDLHRLQDDLARTQRFFSETGEGINALYAMGPGSQKESHASWRELERLLDDGADVLRRIEQFVDSLQRTNLLGEPKELGKRRRVIWMTSARKVAKLRTQLKSITGHACRLLIAQNVSVSADIRISLERSHDEITTFVGSYLESSTERITAHTEKTLQESQSLTVAQLGKVLELSHHAIISHMDYRLKALESGISIPAKSTESMTNNISVQVHHVQLGQPQNPHERDDTMAAMTAAARDSSDSDSIAPTTPRITSACAPSCQCRCHTSSNYSWSLTSLRPVLGSLALSYRGHSTRGCSLASCDRHHHHRHRGREIRAVYHLPTWLVRASLAVFYSASPHGSPQLVLRVVNHLSAADGFGPGTLCSLALNRDVAGARRLLQAGGAASSVYDVVGPYRQTPLIIAVCQQDIPMIRLLLQAGSDPHQEAMTNAGPTACAAGIVVKYFIMGRACDVEMAREFPIYQYLDEAEFSPLHQVVMGLLHVGDLGAALRQERYAADVNARNVHGLCPLEMAVMRGDVAAARVLIRAGADVDGRDEAGSRVTPLLRACLLGRYDMAKFLLSVGADVGVVDVEGWNAVHLIANTDFDTVMPLLRLMAKHGADFHCVDKHGVQPLTRVAEAGTVEAARFLIEYGADINHRDPDGDTVLGFAVLCRYPKLVGLLLDRGIDARVVNKHGQNILHRIAMQGTMDVLEVFIEKAHFLRGVSTAAKDATGKTPLQRLNEKESAPEFRATFDKLLDAVERAYHGEDEESDDEFFDAEESF